MKVAHAAAQEAQLAAEAVESEAAERISTAVDAEKAADAALARLNKAQVAADAKAEAAKAEIAADRRTLKAECDEAAVAAGDLRAERAAFEEQRANTAEANKRASDDIARADLALDAREAAVAAAEADYAERIAKLKALAG